MRRDFVLTGHLLERFVARTIKHYAHLETCTNSRCPKCVSLCYDMRRKITYERGSLKDKIQERLAQSSESRWYINDSNLMQRFYQQYGFDKVINFLVHEDLVFVVIVDAGKHVVVTCIPSDHYDLCRETRRPKFQKKLFPY